MMLPASIAISADGVFSIFLFNQSCLIQVPQAGRYRALYGMHPTAMTVIGAAAAAAGATAAAAAAADDVHS